MVVVVLPPQVVDVGGAHQRPAELTCDLHDPLVRLVLVGEPVALDLEVDVVRPEDLQQVVGVSASLGRAVIDDAAAEA